jgi:RNA 2',3'-cyclic 3'-phosphodiesterase
MPEQTVRAFVAIELPDEIRALLESRQQELRAAMGRHAAAVRWTRPESVHVTLQFLGDVPRHLVGTISAAMENACADARPAHLLLDGLGAFPNARKPRVLWASLGGDIDTLSALETAIGDRLTALGYKPDKPFQPHITLGRVRQNVRPDELWVISKALTAQLDQPAEDVPFTIDSVSLMESHLQQGGSVYTRLARVSFDVSAKSET